MAAIRSKDTGPEMIVRRFLLSKGLRYRVNCRKLPGSPDIVLRKYKTVVFIDGCFWHGHQGCKYYRLPKTNVDFWRQKIAMNIARDYSNNVDLQLAGWRVIRIWECGIRTKGRRAETLEKLFQSSPRPRPAPPTALHRPPTSPSPPTARPITAKTTDNLSV